MTFVVHFRRTLRHAGLPWGPRSPKSYPFQFCHVILLLSLVATLLLFNINFSPTLQTVVRNVAHPSHFIPSPVDATLLSEELAPSLSNSTSRSSVSASQSASSASPHGDAYEPLPSQIDAIVGEGHSAKKVLVNIYALPSVIVQNMTQQVATRLYWKLVYTDVIRALRLHTPPTSVSSPASQPKSQLQPHATVLFVHTQNGLGNRLRSLASGLSLARATQRVPVVIWQKDAHLGASLPDLFRIGSTGSDINTVLYKDLIVMDQFPDWPAVPNPDPHWRPFNYMQKDGKHAHTDALIRFELPSDPMALSHPPDRPVSSLALHAVIAATPRPISDRAEYESGPVRQHQHVYFKSAYVANAWPTKLSSRHVVNNELRALTPSPAVAAIVQRMNDARMRHSYGVHIRSRTLMNDNVAVDNGCEYTHLGAYTTDYWRSRSQVPVFVEKMRQKIRTRKDATFFVAADDTAIMQTLKDYFPGRVDTIKRDCDDRDVSCVVYAMADLLCLAKTRRIYGSNWSSFSEVAGRLSNRRLYLSGRDFGRPRRMSRMKRFLTTWPVEGWKWWLSLLRPYSACPNDK